MKKITKKIVAIGGVGFTQESDNNLDQFFLDQCSKKKIKLGFLATASKDHKNKIDLFYKKFENKNLDLSHFNLTQKIDNFSSWILNKDIIYVGGGNTSFMLDVWKKNSLDKIFKKAYENGIVLAGVSAGAGCWFDWVLSDSVSPGLKPLKGIGLISGSCTPHSSEEKRINQFELNIKNGELPPGLAIDDGSCSAFY